MRRPVEVAGRDCRQAGRRDPAKGPIPVEELEPVDQTIEATLVAPEPACRSESSRIRVTPVRVRRHNRRAEPTRLADRLLQPGLERVERAQSEREGVRGLVGIGIVIGELEPRNDEQAVLIASPPGLPRDCLQLVRVRSAFQAERRT